MNEQNSAVLENPVVSEGVADLISQEAGAPQPGNVVDLNTQQLPGITPPTAEDIAKAKATAEALVEAQKAAGLVRFESNFKLESEVIGVTKRSVSKKGAVTLGLLPVKSKDGASLQSASAAMNGGTEMKGEALQAFSRLNSDKFKTVQVQEFVRLGGDAKWTGFKMVLNAKGNEATFKLKKVEPMKVTVTAEPTDDAIAKAMGWTVEQVKASREAKRLKDAADNTAKELADKEAAAKAAKALADEEAQKALDAEEAARKSATNNGHVDEVQTSETED